MGPANGYQSGQAETLDLGSLSAGSPGMMPAFGESLGHAASICLETQGHNSGVGMSVSGDFVATFRLEWNGATEQMRRTWNDAQVAIEHGAYGIAALLVDRLTDLTIIERSKKGTGFDYWLGRKVDDPGILFQERTRLEVSGIGKGDNADVQGRVQVKKRQVAKYTYALPFVVIVVEFGAPQSRMVRS
jgi:hypothetical protein